MRIICSKCKLICLCSCKPIGSSVRRMFERGEGAGNLKIMKTKRKISPLRISPFSCPKLGEDQKKKKKNRKKSLKENSLKLVRFLAQISVKTKKKQIFTQILSFCVLKLSAQVTKRGEACRNFAYYSMLITLS